MIWRTEPGAPFLSVSLLPQDLSSWLPHPPSAPAFCQSQEENTQNRPAQLTISLLYPPSESSHMPLRANALSEEIN